MKYEENRLFEGLKYRRNIEQEVRENHISASPEQAEAEQNELFAKIQAKIAELADKVSGIDERKLVIFRHYAESACMLAREIEIDVSAEVRGNRGVIQLFTDILLLEDPVEKWVRKIYQNLVSNADSLWYEVVERYGEKVICMNMYYELVEE